MESALLRSSCYSPLLLEAKDVHHTPSSSSARFASTTITCSSRSHAFIPKLEPFSRPKFERFVKDPPLIEKSENELSGINIMIVCFWVFVIDPCEIFVSWVRLVIIGMVLFIVSDYCSTLEGDNSYSCWRAYFELKDLAVSFCLFFFFFKSISASCKILN
jgi:hypothetical protein